MGTSSSIYIMLLVQSETGMNQLNNVVQITEKSNHLFWGSIALNILLLIIWIYSQRKLTIKNNDLKKKHLLEIKSCKDDYRKKSDDYSKKCREVADLENDLNILKAESEEKNSTENIIEENNSIVIELSVDDTSIETSKSDNNSIFNLPKLDSSSKTFYASCEQENEIGYLIIEDKRTHKTPYQIQESDGKYYFVVDTLNRDALKNAINFYNIYINPFCIPINTFQDYYQSFIAEQNSKGLLEKEGDKYRVVEKLRIRFLES